MTKSNSLSPFSRVIAAIDDHDYTPSAAADWTAEDVAAAVGLPAGLRWSMAEDDECDASRMRELQFGGQVVPNYFYERNR